MCSFLYTDVTYVLAVHVQLRHAVCANIRQMESYLNRIIVIVWKMNFYDEINACDQNT